MERLNSRIIQVAVIAIAVLVAPAAISVSPTVLVWGVLPTITAVALLGVSVHAIVRQSSATQVVLGILTISLAVMSLWSLKRMVLDDAWPTYLPYYAIGIAIPFAVIQSHLAGRK